ncbi:glycoside hydrolase family 2 TIM barrel-domain containing protein [Prolixibacter sp. SD074]|uniref:glycoside hydrolase family 2 protein n=1 Tax=Prolixibacter sp. SD074 TaxID=2652391 RepID=UPI001276DE54|nr:beta galactosidase jelly roll domain-containing protein [Prolixibacter sp. SD074]GET30553.1 beta-mannosidase [Prolixibacter sp. SD074]
MKRELTQFLFLILFLFAAPDLQAQDGIVKQTQITNFQLQSSAVIDASGETLSSPSYQENVYWFPVKVPSTVLTGLVANNVYPDPYQGMNNMYIPDASDSFNKEYNLEQYSFLPNNPNPWKKPYWYRTSFKVPANDNGRHFQLIFKGINYRAAVWLNGKQIADSTDMAGMFAEYSLDVSKEIKAGAENYLAVKIYPLDFPGTPAPEQLKAMGPFFANGGPTGDIGKNVTMLCSVGWDWMPPTRDRNMGIWQPVYLRTSGAVTISRPHLVTRLPALPDTTVTEISLKLHLANHGSSNENGKLNVTITPENFSGSSIEFSKEVALNANSSTKVDLNPENEKRLHITNPHLWWPNGHGAPNLYRIRLQYLAGNTVSDDTTFVFGIRTMSTKATEVKGKFLRRDFYVNGKRVNLVGGAWVPDMMVNRDSLRYDNELRLCRNGNINLVRIWGGGITPPDEFFNAADRYGLLVWSDFWVTGDTQGEFKGSPDWPLEGNVFIKNMTSTILRIRNHPSLLLWTGGNEGHARKELYYAMRDSIIKLDGTRPFIPSSSGFAKLPADWKASWPDNKQSGVYSGGPYAWQDPKQYYNLASNAKDWVFKDETGIPSQPPYNILPKIIPDLVWDKTLPFPLNNTWGYHDAASGNGKYDLYYKDMVKRFGEPKTMKGFSEKMQLMNAMGYQGIFEAAGSKLSDNGGVMLWKINAALPSVIWQVYDWYLMPNAGYYFMQNAVGPVHVQYDQDNASVTVVNRSYKRENNLVAEADVYNIHSKLIHRESKKVSMDAESVKKAYSLSKVLAKTEGVSFVVLRLKDANGKVISHNSYWLSPDDDFTPMNEMDEAQVELKVLNKNKEGSHTQWTVELTNPSDKLAFFVRPMLMNRGEEVLPSLWSSSYFTLKPGESRTVTVSTPVQKLDKSGFRVEGWNIEPVCGPNK